MSKALKRMCVIETVLAFEMAGKDQLIDTPVFLEACKRLYKSAVKKTPPPNWNKMSKEGQKFFREQVMRVKERVTLQEFDASGMVPGTPTGQGAAIGAGVGALGAAGVWAMKRLQLRSKMQACNGDPGCMQQVQGEIAALRNKALIGGVAATAGGAAIGAGAGAMGQQMGKMTPTAAQDNVTSGVAQVKHDLPTAAMDTAKHAVGAVVNPTQTITPTPEQDSVARNASQVVNNLPTAVADTGKQVVDAVPGAAAQVGSEIKDAAGSAATGIKNAAVQGYEGVKNAAAQGYEGAKAAAAPVAATVANKANELATSWSKKPTQ